MTDELGKKQKTEEPDLFMIEKYNTVINILRFYYLYINGQKEKCLHLWWLITRLMIVLSLFFVRIFIQNSVKGKVYNIKNYFKNHYKTTSLNINSYTSVSKIGKKNFVKWLNKWKWKKYLINIVQKSYIFGLANIFHF